MEGRKFVSQIFCSLHFNCGKRFLVERYFNSDHLFTKFNETYFFVKGIFCAILKVDECWVSCECLLGNGGQCSHLYAPMTHVGQ